VHWTHFGGGPGLRELQAIVQRCPAHVRATLHGEVPHERVMEHYRTRPVDLFVLISGHEGVPVSLMEAASFGIPLLASAVGGTPEVVCEATGRTLPADADAGAIAAWLDGPAVQELRTAGFRAGVRAFWQSRFEAGTNLRRMAAMLSAG
jgi:glycosyltransferase involved in cell wall biosynthesis